MVHRGHAPSDDPPLWVRAALGGAVAWMAAFAVVAVARPGEAVVALVQPSGWIAFALCVGVLAAAAGRTGNPRAWRLIAAGLGAQSAGDAVLVWGLAAPAGASALDGLYVAAKLLLVVGVLALLAERRAAREPTVWQDTLVAGLSVAAIAAWLIVEPLLAHAGGQGAAAAVLQVVYPVGDGVLIVLAAVGAGLVRWRLGRTWTLVVLGAVALVVANAAWARGLVAGTWTPLALTNLGWNLGVVLLARAAWRPATAWRPAAADDDGARDVLLPLAFALASVALLVAGPALGAGTVPVALAAAALAAALVRLSLTARAHARLLEVSRLEAHTDALTGLGNRRRMVRDLEAALDPAAPGEPLALVLFDLDGFKALNDRLGHEAGDALLVALGGELAAEVGLDATYRLGGDEFCALVRPRGEPLERAVERAAAVVTGAGAWAGVSSSHGAVVLPAEAGDPSGALALADRRMYAHKVARRAAGGPLAAATSR